MTSSELVAIVMFTLVFNIMWYFILKYQKEKDKNTKQGDS